MTSFAHRSSVTRSVAVLAAAVALSLAACGNSNKQSVVTPASTAASSSTTTATTVASTTTTTVAPTTTEATTTTIATTTTAAPEPTTTAPAPVEIPAAAPAGSLVEIPKIGMTQAMLEGIELSILDEGIGHWPGTAMPGQTGNVVLAGHRVSHTKPFRNIDKLVEGDEVFMTVSGTKFRYVVTGHEIVTPDQIRIIEQTPEKTATLFACHPPGSTDYRWVTYLKYAP
jgi:sortase A